MIMNQIFRSIAMSLAIACSVQAQSSDDSTQWKPLFNGKDLSGWEAVNVAPDTFTVRDGMIISTGKPTGVLRTDRMFENCIVELEWRHMKEGGNAGLFLWGDGIPSVGIPFTRGIEVQILDNAYNASGKNERFTKDLFSSKPFKEKNIADKKDDIKI